MKAVVLALIAACSSPVVHPSITENTPIPLPDAWVTCRSDADCVAIEMSCCDHCNGGWVLAVERGHEERARQAYHADCSSWERRNPDGTTSFCGASCTELGCGAIDRRCAAGRCTWSWDASFDGHFVDQPNVVLPARSPVRGQGCGSGG